jgi:hypothetical protein
MKVEILKKRHVENCRILVKPIASRRKQPKKEVSLRSIGVLHYKSQEINDEDRNGTQKTNPQEQEQVEDVVNH